MGTGRLGDGRGEEGEVVRLWPGELEGAGLVIRCYMGPEVRAILVDHLMGGWNFQVSRYTIEMVYQSVVADVGEAMLVVVMLGYRRLGIAAPCQTWC